jgi:hypothetical protein
MIYLPRVARAFYQAQAMQEMESKNFYKAWDYLALCCEQGRDEHGRKVLAMQSFW